MPLQLEPEALVVDLMASDPIVVAAELPVAKVAEVLTDYDIGGVPVVVNNGAALARFFAQGEATLFNRQFERRFKRRLHFAQ